MTTSCSALTEPIYVTAERDQTTPTEDEIVSARNILSSSTTDELIESLRNTPTESAINTLPILPDELPTYIPTKDIDSDIINNHAWSAKSFNIERSERMIHRFGFFIGLHFNSRALDRSLLKFSKPRTYWITQNETKLIEQESSLENTLIDTLTKIFENSYDETFEDGMDSVFYDQLKCIILTYGNHAIHALERVMYVNRGEVTEEALIHLGQIQDVYTHHRRLDLLKHKLKSSNSRIRDAALIGIASMNDSASIPNLCVALTQENDQQMQQNIKTVLQQLQNT